MSTIVLSAIAAAAFGAVPPYIGSEPVPVNFDHVPAPAQHVAFQGANLAASLGSEPMLAGVEAASSRVAAPGKRATAPATLAQSLGSVPFVVAFDDGGASGSSGTAEVDTTARAGTDPDRTKVVAAPEAELEALLASQPRDARPEPERSKPSDRRTAAAQPERSPEAVACGCKK